jgi:hypothetical protein
MDLGEAKMCRLCNGENALPDPVEVDAATAVEARGKGFTPVVILKGRRYGPEAYKVRGSVLCLDRDVLTHLPHLSS